MAKTRICVPYKEEELWPFFGSTPTYHCLDKGHTMAEKLICEQCGGDSPTDARFCIDCGATVAPAATGPTTRLQGVRCPGCGSGNPEHARFCVVCGRGLTPDAMATQPRPQPVAPPISQPRAHSAHQHSYPQVAAPQAPQIGPPQRPYAPARRSHGWHNPAPIFVIGLLFLLITRSLWPGILVLIGVTNFLKSSSRGHGHHATMALLWWVGLAFLFATRTFWPGILVLIGGSMLLSGRGRGGWWW